MTRSNSPSPVNAAVGLVAATVGGIRRLPSRAVLAAGAIRHGYTELAERGEAVLARRDHAPAAPEPTPAWPTAVLPELPDDLPDVDANIDKDALPLPDYDHLTVPQLRSRIRSLDVAGLAALLEYETEHADRAPVVTVLRNRIASVAAEPAQ